MKRSIFLSIGIAITTTGFCSAQVARDDRTFSDVTAQSHVPKPGMISVAEERESRQKATCIYETYALLKNAVTESIKARKESEKIDLRFYTYAAAFLKLYPVSHYPEFTQLASQTKALRSLIHHDTYELLDEMTEEALEDLKAKGL